VAALPDELLAWGAQLEGSGRTVRLTLPPPRTTGNLLDLLGRLGMPVADLETKRAGLEEVFLQITRDTPANDRKSP
jgi:ABC-2 type transport system ATP-binding protein